MEEDNYFYNQYFGDDNFKNYFADNDNFRRYLKQSRFYKEFHDYLKVENDLEDMICDEILDIYVDTDGTFHYVVTDAIKSQLPEGYCGKMSTFADILSKRNLNISKYNRYRMMLRKKNP